MSSPKTVLERHGLHPKRSFGQNFLADPNLLGRIAKVAGPPALVVEIGAGLGALTRALLDAGHRVAAIERDRDLVPVLRAEFTEALTTRQLLLVEADAKQVDYDALFTELAHTTKHESAARDGAEPSSEASQPRSLTESRVLIGNLPYQLTGPLLRRAIELAKVLSRAVFLVQLEVADRLVARVDSDDYGMLSVFAQSSFEIKREMLVRRGAFYPQPRVDSAVVSLLPSEQHPGVTSDAFSTLVTHAFQQRRKRLKNAWSRLPHHGIDLAKLTRAAAELGIDLQQRGETLSPNQFAALAASVSRG